MLCSAFSLLRSHSYSPTDAAGVSVCPPVALRSGLGLLCGLLRTWGQVPAGVLVLAAWLLGGEEGESDEEAGPAEEEAGPAEEFSGLVSHIY